jgi:hypothetical protein
MSHSEVPLRVRAFVAATLATVALLGATEAAAQAPTRVATNCNRACFEALVERYLAAVVAHDPSTLPLSADVQYTENEQVLATGDGFWQTATGRGNYGHYFADPGMGQAAWLGTMREGNTLLLMALRLRVELGRITEIETSYFRPGGGGPNDITGMDARGEPERPWLDTIPTGERSTRSELIEIANAYFDGVQRNDGKGHYPIADDCDRIENGARTTNNPTGPTTPGGFNYMALDCKKQLESGYLAIVTSVHQRRFPLVDEDRGVVLSNAIFDLGGTVRSIGLTNGETVDMGAFAGRASSIEVTEAFKIENGRIRRIEMLGSSVPYHLNSAWGGLSGR